MNKNKYITFDIETLGNGPTAPIVQIAAVKFDEDGSINDAFNARITPDSLERFGFTAEFETTFWWLSQDREAQVKVFSKDNRIAIDQALYELSQFIGSTSDYLYFSHATFDPPVLEYAYRKIGKQNPIPFRLQRDIRTIVDIGGVGKDDIPRNPHHVEHDALGDCMHQAKYIAANLKKINSK